jgi:high affinity Mn2+ porin
MPFIEVQPGAAADRIARTSPLAGRGFLLGDGALRYGWETLGEVYHRAQLGRHVTMTPDAMFIVNPGYNRDRGPARVYSLRVRIAN